MRPAPIGQMINAYYEARERLREATTVVNIIKEEMADLETRLIETMETVGVESSRAELATATITESTTARIEDWDSYVNWVRKRPALRMHLFEKRIAQLAFREMMEQGRGKLPPGITTYTRKKISLLKRS